MKIPVLQKFSNFPDLFHTINTFDLFDPRVSEILKWHPLFRGPVVYCLHLSQEYVMSPRLSV